MSLVPTSEPMTVARWMALEDPPGGRYEVLDGELFVNPSASSRHNRLAEDLADVLRVALRRAAVEATVTVDVEWRVTVDGIVREALRPDVAVGWIDPATDRLGGAVPPLVVEVWDERSEAYVVRAKRRYWAGKGARWLWELTVGDDPSLVVAEVWDLHANAFAPALTAHGDEPVELLEPFPVSFRPAELPGWSEQQALQREILAAYARDQELRAQAEADRAAFEASRADAETNRADAEAVRADAEARRADAEAQRAARLAERLRALGEDVDDLS